MKDATQAISTSGTGVSRFQRTMAINPEGVAGYQLAVIRPPAALYGANGIRVGPIYTPPELRRRVVEALGSDAAAPGVDAPAAARRSSRPRRRAAPRRWSVVAVPALAAIAIVLAVIAIAGGGGGHSTRATGAAHASSLGTDF